MSRFLAVLLVVLPGTLEGAERRLEEPTGPLTLAKAVAIALAGSPQLAALAGDVRVAEVRRLHAGQWVNPQVSIQLEDALGTGSLSGLSQAQTTLELGQVFELGGKVGARQTVALREAENATRDYERERTVVASEAALRFAHVLGDQHRVVLAREAVLLTESALTAAQKRVASGAASNVEERRARVVLARSRIDEEHALHELLASRRSLAAVWGSTEPKFEAASGDLYARAPLPAFAELAARIADNPELRRLASEQLLRDAEVALAQARAYPDVRVAAGARRLEGADAVAFLANASVPLPIFSRNQAEIEARQAARAKLADEQEAARVRLLAELFAQYQEVAHVLTALDTLEKEVLPQAAGVMQTTEEGFKLGRLSQLELVDAQRTLMEVRKEHIDTAEEYHSHVVRLERLLGGPLAASPKGQEEAP